MFGHLAPADPAFCLQRAGFVTAGIEDKDGAAPLADNGRIERAPLGPRLRADQPAVAPQTDFLAVREHHDGRRGRFKVGRSVVGSDEDHRPFVEPRLRDRRRAHALQQVVAELRIAVHVDHPAIHRLVLAAPCIVVVAPEEMTGHGRIGIQHAPVEIAFPFQLEHPSAALAHLLLLVLPQADTGLFAYPVAPFAGEERFHSQEVLGIIAHHIPVFREAGHLLVEHIVVGLHVGMAEIVAGRVELIARVFLVRQLEEGLGQRDRVARLVQGRFPKHDRRVVAVAADHLPAHLIQPVDKRGVGVVELPARDALHHQQPMTVARLEESRVGGIVGGTDSVVAAPLHLDDIPLLHRIGGGIPDMRESLVAVGAAQVKWFPVEEEALGGVAEGANAYLLRHFVDHLPTVHQASTQGV